MPGTTVSLFRWLAWLAKKKFNVFVDLSENMRSLQEAESITTFRQHKRLTNYRPKYNIQLSFYGPVCSPWMGQTPVCRHSQSWGPKRMVTAKNCHRIPLRPLAFFDRNLESSMKIISDGSDCHIEVKDCCVCFLLEWILQLDDNLWLGQSTEFPRSRKPKLFTRRWKGLCVCLTGTKNAAACLQPFTSIVFKPF